MNKVVRAVIVLMLLSAALFAQAPTREHRSVFIPNSLIASLNTGLEKIGYHLNSSNITEHLSDGIFQSVTGQFSVSCPGGERRKVDMVVPPTPILSDSSRQQMKEGGLRALTIDEMIADLDADGLLQISVAQYLVGLIKKSCLASSPAILALSLWVSKDSRHYPSYSLIDSAKFSALAR